MIPDTSIYLGKNSEIVAEGTLPIGKGILPGSINREGLTINLVLGGDSAQTRKSVLSTVAYSNTTFVIQLKDSEGAPVNLRETDTVLFVVKKDPTLIKDYINTECGIINSVEGIIEVHLEEKDIPWSGLWNASVVLLNNQHIQGAYDIYLELTKNYTRASSSNKALTIAEIRQYVMDNTEADNDLFDDLEFNDADIIMCLHNVIDEWNETAPIIQKAIYTPANFPYRLNCLKAVEGKLYNHKGRNLMRNRAPYKTSSGEVDLNARSQMYLQLADKADAAFKDWMSKTKYAINANACYGGMGSNYF